MANFFSLTDLGLEASSSQLLDTWLTSMQAAFPGYSPSAANLEYVQAQIFSSFAADIAQLASNGATELFRVYATTLVGVPYQQGTAAQALISIQAQQSNGTIATGSSLLSTATTIVGIPVVALQYGIAAGTVSLTDPALAHSQTFTTSGCLAGATFIPVSPVMPNFNYPVGSTITGTQAYVLPVLSQFTLDQFGFFNLPGYTINAGTSQNITLTAVQTGSDFNGAGQGGLVESVQQLDWIDTITLIAAAANGQDPEDDQHYLDRVTTALQLQAPRPITASDYAVISFNFTPFPGTDQQDVGRATSIDGYNPVDQTFNNTRMVAVAATDINGFALNNDTLYGYPNGSSANIITTVPNTNSGWGLAGWLESLREIDFVVNVIQPTYSPIYVTVHVKASAGYDAATVQLNVQSVLLAYLSPPDWGLPLGNNGWFNTTTIYQSQLAARIQGTLGVDFIFDNTLRFDVISSPANIFDLPLPGAVPLPTSTILTIPTSAITVS